MAFLFEDTQILQQLEARRGGYFYALIPAVEVMSWARAKKKNQTDLQVGGYP